MWGGGVGTCMATDIGVDGLVRLADRAEGWRGSNETGLNDSRFDR